MRVRSNVLCTEFAMLDSKSRRFLFNAQCMSLYGGEFIKLDDIASVNKLCVNWRKCCRRITNVPSRTHCNLVPELMCSKNISTIVQQRILNFLILGLSHSNGVVNFIFRNCIMSYSSYLVKNLNIIMQQHKIRYFDIFKGKKLKLFDADIFDEKWKINFINELIDCIENDNISGFSRQEMSLMLNFLCTD